MQRRHEIELATLVSWVALAFVFVLAGSPDLIAQSPDPLVGTWNMSGSSNGNSPFISVEILAQVGQPLNMIPAAPIHPHPRVKASAWEIGKRHRSCITFSKLRPIFTIVPESCPRS